MRITNNKLAILKRLNDYPRRGSDFFDLFRHKHNVYPTLNILVREGLISKSRFIYTITQKGKKYVK